MSAQNPSKEATAEAGDGSRGEAMAPDEAQRRQDAYAASRRAWAEKVGRPYRDEPDLRPPPGELDVAADE